jgi:hypothetical protein
MRKKIWSYIGHLGTAHYLLYRGGLRRNWGGPLNFLKPERRALKKYRETKEGGLCKYLPV